MKKIAIGLTHGHASKWLQVITHSLHTFHNNEVEPDIYIAHSWPGYPSIKAITETQLGDGITIIDCKIRKQSHATGLDEILDFIADMEYEYLFTCEDDCMAVTHGWLDWFYSFVKDKPNIGMAGFFWSEGHNHYNINPSATIYRKDMLLKYHREVRENKENTFWHPRGNRDGNEAGMDPTIKDVAGVFSETRGIKNPNKRQETEILQGVPQAAWFEPGSWLYYRSLGEYDHIAVPVDHIYQAWAGGKAPEATYYGGKMNPKFIHFWGGTRAWDHLKHPVNDRFVKGCSPQWLDREHSVWTTFVPDQYRTKVDEIYQEIGIKGMGYDKN